MRTALLSALIVGCVLTNLDTAFGQRGGRGRVSRNSRNGERTSNAAINSPGETQRGGKKRALSRQQTAKAIAQLNSEIKQANRNNDPNRALNASLKKLNIAVDCPYPQLPKAAWVRKSCEVITAVFEERKVDRDNLKKEVLGLLAGAQTALLANKEQKHSKQNAELLQLVLNCRLRVSGASTPNHAELVSQSLADSYMRVALEQFAYPKLLRERESSWLLELVEHGASLTIEDPTTDPGINRKLAELGLTVDKIQSTVSMFLAICSVQ
ncbi:hypothetical protein ACFL2H_01265 [Planctomycetota bacterium]